jgi:hippurate hydrolase
MLGAVHYLCGAREELPYNVLFVFQPAEEGTRGAKAMLDHGLLDKAPQKPVRIFGIHNRPEIDCGDVVVHKGPLMSEKSTFRITYTGVPGHASLPHKCIDPIIAAASLVSGIQSVVSRNVDPFEPGICTVNSLTAGNPDIPAPLDAVVTGYIRSFDKETHRRMRERLVRLAESTAEAYECRCDTDVRHAVPALVNTDAMYDIALRAVESALGAEHAVDCRACLASEDFAVYGEYIPSFFYWVGSGTPGKKCAPWHDPDFCADPHYPETAVPVMCASALTR